MTSTPNQLTITLRLLAASLVTLSGAGRVASLWFRDLDQQAVFALLLGAVYLIVGIGLFGQSRFVLFVSIALCSTVALYSLPFIDTFPPLQQTGIATDIIVVCLSAIVLWQVRNRPSV
jgi:hypothetical protein